MPGNGSWHEQMLVAPIPKPPSQVHVFIIGKERLVEYLGA
jgi:hypothetical protein